MQDKQSSLNIIVTQSTINTIENDMQNARNKKEACQAFRKNMAKKISEIKEYKICEESRENMNFFSIMMDKPTDIMIELIRLNLAFLEEDINVQKFLESLEWDNDSENNLKFYCTQKNQINENLMKLCNDPEKILTDFKMALIRDYADKVQEHLNNSIWNPKSFPVLAKMYEIVLNAIKLKDFLIEELSNCSISIEDDLIEKSPSIYEHGLLPNIPKSSKSKATLSTKSKSSKRRCSHKTQGSLPKLSKSPSRSSNYFTNGFPNYLSSTACIRGKCVNSEKSLYSLPEPVPKVDKPKAVITKEPIQRIDTQMMENYRMTSLRNLEKCNILKENIEKDIVELINKTPELISSKNYL